MGTTLSIVNNLIVINLDKFNTYDTFVNGDKQTIVILLSHLGGYTINYTERTITLYLTLKALQQYVVDFKRGSERVIVQSNFDAAVGVLCGTIKKSDIKLGKRSRETF